MTDAPLNTLSLDTSIHPESERFDAWQEFGQGHLGLRKLVDGSFTDVTRIKIWQMPSLTFTEFEHGPVLHTAATEIREKVFFRIQTKGRYVTHVDHPAVASAGSILFTDRVSGGRQAHHNAGVRFSAPYETVGYDPSQFKNSVSIDVSSPFGQVLTGGLAPFVQAMETATGSDMSALEAGILGLMRAFLHQHRAEEEDLASFRQAQILAMRRFVERNFLHADISAVAMCARFGVSRSSLFRAFEEVGGLASYAARCRVIALFEELAITKPARGAVARIAPKWGFPDASQLHRQFVRHIGIPPSEAVGVAYIPA